MAWILDPEYAISGSCVVVSEILTTC